MSRSVKRLWAIDAEEEREMMNKESRVIIKNYPDCEFDSAVYKTSNYDMFHKLHGNRDVDKTNRIKKIMKKRGFMKQPILVNESFEIVEGQHRYEAAKELGIPLLFVVQEGIGLEETIDLNVSMKNWGVNDYIYSYAQSNINYSRFKQLIDTFSFDVYVTGASIGYSIEGGTIVGIAKNGRLVCTNEQYEEAIVTLNWFKGFRDLLNRNKMKGSRRYFYAALLFASNHPRVNTEALTKRVTENFHLYGNYIAGMEDAITKTEKAYNYRIERGNKVNLLGAWRDKKFATKSS